MTIGGCVPSVTGLTYEFGGVLVTGSPFAINVRANTQAQV